MKQKAKEKTKALCMWSSRRFPARKDSRRSFKVILTRPLTSFEEKIISFQRHLSSRHYKPKHLIKSKIKPLQYEVVLPAVRQILLFGQNSPEEDYRLETKNYLFHSLIRASLTYQDKKKRQRGRHISVLYCSLHLALRNFTHRRIILCILKNGNRVDHLPTCKQIFSI